MSLYLQIVWPSNFLSNCDETLGYDVEPHELLDVSIQIMRGLEAAHRL
jgi:hypothetical protein